MNDDAPMLLEQQIRSCRRCADILSKCPTNPPSNNTPVEPRPIASKIAKYPIMLIGQAPGLTEYRTGMPFQGGAGQQIRAIFAEAGIAQEDFDALIYSTSIVKCFPGSKLVERRGMTARREDRVPPTEMVRNCMPFLTQQIAAVNPQIIVTLGGFPLKAYLRLRGRQTSEGILSEFVGKSESWNGRTIIFLPHTSGTSRWLNSASNKGLLSNAKNQLVAALRALKADEGRA